jgi:hypothetical protein
MKDFIISIINNKDLCNFVCTLLDDCLWFCVEFVLTCLECLVLSVENEDRFLKIFGFEYAKIILPLVAVVRFLIIEPITYIHELLVVFKRKYCFPPGKSPSKFDFNIKLPEIDLSGIIGGDVTEEGLEFLKAAIDALHAFL